MNQHCKEHLEKAIDILCAATGSSAFSVILDEPFTLLYGDERYYQMHEYTKASMLEILGNQCAKYVHPEDLPRVRESCKQSIAHGESRVEWDMRIVTGRGRIKYIRVTGTMADLDGQPVLHGFVIDRTENETLRHHLNQTTTHLQSLMDHIPSGVAVFEAGTPLLDYINAGAYQMLGYRYEEFIRHTCSNPLHFVHPQDIPKVLACIDCSKQHQPQLNTAFRIRCKDGSYKWIKLIANPVSADGKVLYFASFSDPFLEKEAHTLATLNEERLKVTLSHMNTVMFDNVFEADITKDCLLGESAEPLTKFLKIPPDSTYTATIQAISDQLTRPDFAEEYRRVLSRENMMDLYGKGIQTMQYECVERTDGIHYTWIRIHYCIYRSEISDTIRIISCVKNIEKEKNQAIQLITKAQNAFIDYEQITELNATNDSFITYAAKGASKNTQLISGCFSKEVETVASRIIAPSERQNYLSELNTEHLISRLNQEDGFSISYTVEESGERRSKKVQVFYLDRDMNHICLTRTDITLLIHEEQRKNELLSSALSAAKQANAAKSDFLSHISHEIRTPMNAIIGMSAIAAQSIGNADRVADCLDKIGVSSRFLLSLINDILDMSRIENEKVLLKEETMPFAACIDAINVICDTQAKAKSIDYESIVDSNVEESYIGDSMKLQQVIINILSNAIKFTPDGGKVCLFITQVKQVNRHAVLRFVIQDTGCGISETFIPHLFDPFAQEASMTKNGYGGTGLGLAICKNLVELMHGNIQVQSVVGVGSEFTVEVKLGVIEEGLPQCAEKHVDSFTGRNVLVVDDDVMDCQKTVTLLTGLNMHAEWVDGGRKAVDRIRTSWAHKESFDLILIDWKMPDMDGVDMVKEIRNIVGPHFTAIIMTAYDQASIEHEAKMAGANLLIGKPVLKRSLLSAFQTIWKEKQEFCKKEPQENFDFTGKRILLVEDHPLNVEVAKKLLEPKRLIVEHAENGLRAIEMVTLAPEWYYDAILMDIRMPVMDGLQATQAIRNLRKKGVKTIPIIAMTANAFADDIEKSKKAGMNAHLAKPVDPKQLYQTLYSFICGETEHHND